MIVDLVQIICVGKKQSHTNNNNIVRFFLSNKRKTKGGQINASITIKEKFIYYISNDKM